MRLPILLAAAAVFSAVGSVAHADIVTTLTSAVNNGNGTYSYVYDAQLSSGQLLAAPAGTPVQFGTVYDFGPLVGGSVTSTGILATSFTFTYNLTDKAAALTAPSDDPTLANIRFIYKGATGIAATGTTAIDLGTFTAISNYAPTTNAIMNYDGQTYKNSNTTIQGNAGFVTTPNVTTAATPEPSSLVLLGTGILGVAGAMRRRFLTA